QVRGNNIGIVFQEPMTSLNPLHTLEKQVAETLQIHNHLSAATVRSRTLELLHLVGLRDAENRLNAYPHQLSGGQRHRVIIAMAIANEPDILIADEPTTALDVTIQAQILDLMHSLRDRLGMALLLITHDRTIVRKMSDRGCVMSQGEIVEAVLVEGDRVKVWFPIRSGLLRSVTGHIKAVDGVSLNIKAGTNLGVVGESGS